LTLARAVGVGLTSVAATSFNALAFIAALADHAVSIIAAALIDLFAGVAQAAKTLITVTAAGAFKARIS
jgi:hypothetical protein